MSAGWQNFQLHHAKEFDARGADKKINNPGHHPICEYVQDTPTSHEKFCSPNVGLEPTTLRLRVSCSTDWASRACCVYSNSCCRCPTVDPELFWREKLSLNSGIHHFSYFTIWRRWCSGIMQDSHSCDPGSIPGRRNLFFSIQFFHMIPSICVTFLTACVA